MNRNTDLGNKTWYAIISLITSIISIIVFVTGKNLPDYTKETSISTTQSSETLQTIIPTVITTSTKYESCGSAPPKRLTVGKTATVCTKTETVNLRNEPDHTSNYTHKLVPGAELQVIGDAACDADVSWWYWKVKTESGFEGWIAEGGDERDAYFLCPEK